MNWVLLIVFCGLTLILAAILVPFRERKEGRFSEIDPSPTLRITIFDGSVALELVNRSDLPQWSPQKRPTVVTSKPANGCGPGRDGFTLISPVRASPFLFASSVGHI